MISGAAPAPLPASEATSEPAPSRNKRQTRTDRILGWFFGRSAEVRIVPASWKIYVVFALATLAYPVLMLRVQGHAFVRGQMWAEMGTNYYPTAASGTLLEKLFATDAGYIPFPQRAIALIGELVSLPASAMPYYYSGVAYVLSGLLIATLILPRFRALIASDSLRLVISLSLMLVIDAQTRTFLNFSYLVVLPIVYLTALALVRPNSIPRWAWILPVMVLSKPAVLSVLPAIVLVALVVPGRFRRIALVCAGVGIVQVVRLVISARSGSSLLQPDTSSVLDKLIVSGEHFLAYLLRFIISPGELVPRQELLWGGMVLFVTAVVLALVCRTRPVALVAVAMSASAFSLLISSFALASVFDRTLSLLNWEIFDRRIAINVLCAVVVLGALIAVVAESVPIRALAARLRVPGRADVARRIALGIVPLAFVTWFVAVGWFDYAKTVLVPLGGPLPNVSQWVSNADELDTGGLDVCVPLEPWGWFYGRDCVQTYVDDPSQLALGAVGSSLTIPIPDVVLDSDIESLVIFARPVNSATASAVLVLRYATGGVDTIPAQSTVEAAGGTFQFRVPTRADEAQISSAQVSFNTPMDAARSLVSGSLQPSMMWFSRQEVVS